jgi:hypothetical protein
VGACKHGNGSKGRGFEDFSISRATVGAGLTQSHTHRYAAAQKAPLYEVFAVMRPSFELLPANDRLFALTLLFTSKEVGNLNEN